MMVSRIRVFRNNGAIHIRCLPSRPTTLDSDLPKHNPLIPLGPHFPEDPLLSYFPVFFYQSNNEILVSSRP